MEANRTRMVFLFKDGHKEYVDSPDDKIGLISDISKYHDHQFIGFRDIDQSVMVVNMLEIVSIQLIPIEG